MMDTPAIAEIKDYDSVRVLIFINGRQVHSPLSALLKQLQDQITELTARVTDLETP